MPFSRKPKKLAPEALWEHALRCLDRKPYSTADLQQKLKSRADSPQALREVMNKLQEYGLLNDRKFAESFATTRLERQAYGASRVIRDLRTRRVAAKTAEQAVRQVYGEVDEADLIRQYLKRKFRSKDLEQFLSIETNLASAYRRLRTAGFSADRSIKVLKEFTQRARELEEPLEDVPEENEPAGPDD
ncbi:MAG: regulatory protein RecX [Bryobacteraceae bacterium]